MLQGSINKNTDSFYSDFDTVVVLHRSVSEWMDGLKDTRDTMIGRLLREGSQTTFEPS